MTGEVCFCAVCRIQTAALKPGKEPIHPYKPRDFVGFFVFVCLSRRPKGKQRKKGLDVCHKVQERAK